MLPICTRLLTVAFDQDFRSQVKTCRLRQHISSVTAGRVMGLVALACLVLAFWEGLAPLGYSQVLRLQPTFGARAGGSTARFQYNREAMLRLKKAEELIQEKQWADAVLYLGAILDGGQDYFYPTQDGGGGGGNFRSLKARALELVEKLPAEGQESYQLEYGTNAQLLLEEAVASGDPSKLTEASRRFFHTKAGYQATHRLAMHHWDHGRPLAAALFLQRLYSTPQARRQFGPMLPLKIAACLERVGTEESRQQAERILQELIEPTGGQQPLRIAGRLVKLPTDPEKRFQWLRGVLGPQNPRSLPGKEEWVMVGGNAARNASSVGGLPLLSSRWRTRSCDYQSGAEKDAVALQKEYHRRGTAVLPAMTPLAVKLDRRSASLLKEESLPTGEWPLFIRRLREAGEQPTPSPEKHVWGMFSLQLRRQLKNLPDGDLPSYSLRSRIVDELNAALDRSDFYEPELFEDVELRLEAEQLLRVGLQQLNPGERFRFNRLVLESLFRDFGQGRIWESHADVVLMRTHHNLMAVDFATGKLFWQTEPSETQDFIDRLFRGSRRPRDGSSPASTALAYRLWHDRTFGTLSSDGRLVFSVEGAPTPVVGIGYDRRLGRPQIINRPGRTGSETTLANRLTAHDIRTGKIVWGRANEVPEQLRTVFFMGPPLPLAGNLYAIAEQGGEVRLLVLDADTGGLLWSQSLAQTQQSLMNDPFRQFAGLSPSYADGVLVCPTASGAVVGVDLTNRSLLWGYQYQSNSARGFPPGRFRRTPSSKDLSLTDRWSSSLAILADGHVLLTPPESDQLHCLNLFDGRKLWTTRRDGGLYIGGVRQGKAIIVGQDQIRAVDLQNGKVAWTQRLPEGVIPAGHGFLAEDKYYLPLSNGEVVYADLQQGGKIPAAALRKQRAEGHQDGDSWLGNLICFRGKVLSQDVKWLKSFDELDVLAGQVSQDLQRNPNNARALSRRGEIHLQRGQVRAAVADFRQSLELLPDPSTRQLLVEGLLEGLQTDFRNNRHFVAEIESLLTKLPEPVRPQIKARFLRVLGSGLQSIGEQDAAFRTYLQFADPEVDSSGLERIDANWEVRRDRWVSERVGELLQQAPPLRAAEMDLEVQERLSAAQKANDPESLEHFLDFFGETAAAAKVRLELADGYLQANKLLRAELMLQKLAQSDQPALRGPAVAKLAELLVSAGRPDSALVYYRQLAGPLAEVACNTAGDTGRQIVEKLPEGSPVRQLLQDPHPWPEGQVVAEQTTRRGDSGWRMSPVVQNGPSSPFFPHGSLLMDSRQRRFFAKDATGNVLWETRLQDNQRFRHLWQNPVGNTARSVGHLVLLSTGQHLFALDTLANRQGNDPLRPNQAKTLWSVDFLAGLETLANQPRIRIQARINAAGGQGFVIKDERNQPIRILGPSFSNYVAYVQRRDLIAVDPLSGERLWVRHDCDPNSVLFGDEDYIIVIPTDGGRAQIVRSLTGRLVATRLVPPTDQHVATLGRCLYTWEPSNGEYELACRDLVKDQKLWIKRFPLQSNTRLVDGGREIAIYNPKGRLSIVRLANGEILVDAKVAAEPKIAGVYVLKQQDKYLAILSRPWNRANNRRQIWSVISGVNNPTIHGHVYGFDARSGKQLWHTPVENQAIALWQNSHLPILVFAAQIHERGAPQRCQLMCLDKRNGRIVYQKKFERERVRGYETEADRDNAEVVLKLDQSQVKLRFTDKPWDDLTKNPSAAQTEDSR